MWEILLWFGACSWMFLFCQLILNRAFTRDLSKEDVRPPDEWPFVSIVAPARNEERGVRAAVSSFCRQDYPDFEVIAVDDRSTDDTPRILAELEEAFARLKVIRGEDPPPGWLGKPNALETGRRAASGEWLLFVDADVEYAPDLLRRAVAHALRKEAGMMFLLPNVTTGGVMEAVLMSSLYLVGLAALPVFLVNCSRCRKVAAGGGVFNLVRRDALEAAGAFESLRDAVVDDAGLGFKVKAKGYGLACALAGPLIRIRMYHGARETVEGFTKNVYPALRSLPWLIPVPFLLGFLVSLLPYGALAASLAAGSFSLPAALALLFMHATLGLIALLFRQPWYIAFLNPLREIGWWWILLRSMIVYYRKGIVWRGRSYPARVL